jgi:hypothetical protein
LAEQDKKIALFESALATERLRLKQDEYTLSTLRAADADEDLIKKQEENVNATKEQIKSTTDAVANGYKDRLKITRGFQIEDAKESTNAANKRKEDQKAAADKRASDAKQAADEAKRKKDDQIKLAEDLRRERMTQQQRELDDVKRQYEERLKQANGNRDLEKQAFESAEDQRSKIRLKYQQFNQEKLQEHIDAMLAEEERERQEKKEKEIQDLENKKNKLLTEANDEQLSFDERLAKIQDREALVNQIVFNSEEERTAFTKANADARVKIAKDEAKSKEDQLMQGAALLSNISQLVGKETAAGKATAIAEATINTYLGASKALTGIKKGNPLSAALAITQAAAIIAAGIRNVRQIAATRVPGVGGGGGGSVPAPNISVPAPIAPQAQTTQLDQSSINAVGNAAAGRAFVLNTDIQNNQERIARLNRAARIN